MLSRVLHVGAGLYGTAVNLRNRAYDRGWAHAVRLPCTVISVGNLVVGGTGKTTCVEFLTKKLLTRGRRVAVLSRGYGGARETYWLRNEDGEVMVHGTPHAEGVLADEPRLLARHLEGVPILVGAQRSQTGRMAAAQLGCDTAVLDDGFQHRRVQRDCEIVLVHARIPLGGWPLLPRGLMREPLTSLKRADVVILTKADEVLERVSALGERLRALNPSMTLLTAVHEPVGLEEVLTGVRHAPRRLDGLRLGLLSSIGDPTGFELTVQRLHGTIAWHRAFQDHYRYQASDWVALGEQVRRAPVDAVVTTEKDWVRLQPWAVDHGPWTVPLWVLGVRMNILSGEAALDARLDRLYAR